MPKNLIDALSRRFSSSPETTTSLFDKSKFYKIVFFQAINYLPFNFTPSMLSITNSRDFFENSSPVSSSSAMKLYDLELLTSLPSGRLVEKLTTICLGVLLFSRASFSNLSSISSPKSISHFFKLSKSIRALFPFNCLQHPILFGLNLACTGSKSIPRAMLYSHVL